MNITLNLIPPYKKEKIEAYRRFCFVRNIGLVIAALFICFFAFLFALNQILNMNLESVSRGPENSQDKDQLEKIRQLDAEFEKANNEVKTVMTLKNDQIYWSSLFIHLSRNNLSGITVTALSTKNWKVSLAGKAEDRDKLISLKEALEKDDCFEKVELPLSNLISPNDVDFQLDLFFKENCAKNK